MLPKNYYFLSTSSRIFFPMSDITLNEISKSFFVKVGVDEILFGFFRLFSSSKPVGDDSLGQKFLVMDKSLNDLALSIHENVFIGLEDYEGGFFTYRFTIPLLKKLGADLVTQMQEYLMNLS